MCHISNESCPSRTFLPRKRAPLFCLPNTGNDYMSHVPHYNESRATYVLLAIHCDVTYMLHAIYCDVHASHCDATHLFFLMGTAALYRVC